MKIYIKLDFLKFHLLQFVTRVSVKKKSNKIIESDGVMNEFYIIISYIKYNLKGHTYYQIRESKSTNLLRVIPYIYHTEILNLWLLVIKPRATSHEPHGTSIIKITSSICCPLNHITADMYILIQ